LECLQQILFSLFFSEPNRRMKWNWSERIICRPEEEYYRSICTAKAGRMNRSCCCITVRYNNLRHFQDSAPPIHHLQP